MEPGPVAPAELDDFIRAIIAAFHDTLSDERVAEFRNEHALGRMLAVRDGGRIVATTAIEELELTLPGGPAPVAGVTMVGVLPTHRRRGLATGLMRAQLDALRDGGEAIAALWASEGGIYGRFGYGPAAASGRLRLRTDRTAPPP